MSLKRAFHGLRIDSKFVGAFILGVGLTTVVSILYVLLFTGKQEAPETVSSGQLDQQKSDKQQEKLERLLSLRQEVANLNEKVADVRPVSRPERDSPSTQARPNSRPAAIGIKTESAFKNLKASDNSPYVPTGSVFRAKLLTPIKTSVRESFVLAETIADYQLDSDRKILKNSRLVGSARLNPVLKGVIVRFDRIVGPGGIERDISALALSENALPEIEGLYVSDEAERYGTALAFGFLGGLSEASKSRRETVFGSYEERTASNQVLSGLSTASFRVAEEMLRDLRERAVEYVIVPAGVNVFVALTDRFYPSKEEVSN